MYLVVEWVTISAPHSKGRQLMGVAKVLSTIRGTPCAWAMSAILRMSSTQSVGLEMVSAKRAFVLGRKALAISSAGASWSTKVTSMPIFRNVTAKRLYVPP